MTPVLGTRGPWAGGTSGVGRSWGWVQSRPGSPSSNTASPPPSGAAAAGGRRAGLPRPGPPLPALLLLLAVLPAAQERGAPRRGLLLHGLVRHHRHAGLQVSARGGATGLLWAWPLGCCGLGPAGRGGGGGAGAGSDCKGRGRWSPVGGPQARALTRPRPVPAPVSPWGSMATGRPVTASIGPPTHSVTPIVRWQGSRTA